MTFATSLPGKMTSTSTKIASGSSSPSETGEQLLNKDGSRRKSRVLRRKTDHSIIERRRREKINEKLVALQNLVPACRKECQDLVERKFAAPARTTDAGEIVHAPKQSAKRKREEEKVEKAKREMSEKISTSMVLEKLCIISHTLDFVVRLQEENKALRALCDCRGEREPPLDVDAGLAEHYRSAHRHDDGSDSLPTNEAHERGHRLSVSSVSSSSDLDALPEDKQERPTKRRLHWGSDEVREASAHHGICRHRCDGHTLEEHCQREPSSSPSGDEAVPDAELCDRSALHRVCPASLPCASITNTATCNTLCRTRHSCCREEDSDVSSAASEEVTSPPSCALERPGALPPSNVSYLARQRLPSIVNLGLPKHDSHLPSLASLYRRDQAGASEVRSFRPLSLYTSHVSRPSLTSVKPR